MEEFENICNQVREEVEKIKKLIQSEEIVKNCKGQRDENWACYSLSETLLKGILDETFKGKRGIYIFLQGNAVKYIGRTSSSHGLHERVKKQLGCGDNANMLKNMIIKECEEKREEELPGLIEKIYKECKNTTENKCKSNCVQETLKNINEEEKIKFLLSRVDKVILYEIEKDEIVVKIAEIFLIEFFKPDYNRE